MNKATALIVDDEADIRELVEITLSRMGLKTRAAATLADARALLAQQAFDFCITDMRLPDGNGISLVQQIQRDHPCMPVAMITAYGNAQAAVESLKAGAFDFVSKPVNIETLRKLVDSALRLRKGDSRDAAQTAGLLGEHASIQNLRAMIERLARSQAPVHIAGESGTGKERVARLIHARGPRSQAPFVPVNCGAIPAELMESEFFGHIKGSFTGAVKDKAGLFQSAEGGTLFLDEVADLPLHMQVKLLRAVQERAVRPVGAESEVPVNVRIISATHKSLGDLVAKGAFRQDLYYRLNVIEVRTPALRERGADIPLLAEHILARLAREVGFGTPPQLTPPALRQLLEYPFPGNVRELENILERAITLCDGSHIGPDDLQLRAAAPAFAAPAPMPENAGLGEHIEEIEKQAIRDALEKSRYNKTKAAQLLGMSFRSLRYRIKKLNIE
ncbi:MAG: sigma-54-dependent Fis family transcriptional regulator [Nevskiaceae bacterium]|nr:MAG: sigma-54-dependent Fis family transcriptional regulator [Nevskiaceae bacterium]